MSLRGGSVPSAALDDLRDMEDGTPRVVLGASLVSACGSLPVQILPLVVVLYVSGGWSLQHVGWVSGMLLLGQTLGSLLFPLLAPERLKPGRTLALAAVSCAMMLAVPWLGFVGSMAAWAVIGICASGFQYVGLVTATQAPNPSAAFATRLAVALCLSSLVLTGSAAAGEVSALRVISIVAGLQAVLVLVGATLAGEARRPPEAQEQAGLRDIDPGLALWIIPCFGLLISFMAFLPVTLGAGRSEMEVVLVIGLGRLAAAPLLYLVQGRGTGLPIWIVLGVFPLLSFGAYGGLSIDGLWLAVVFLMFFEVLGNSVTSRFLGELSARHSAARTRWIGMYIQFGSALAQVGTGYALLSSLADIYVLVLGALFIPLVWWVTRPKGAGREVFPPEA
ncbi:hypothetical protein [Sagittula salina]|uniref:Uncharacterized protein n=1 Tax=Sagittula salina TaxID=2820268 RepID=A0A940S1E4_9RHOB|nr:hypothetical protein [Sagittula salina]MBP0483036.1 hypothetical protein [Sagittula salina]